MMTLQAAVGSSNNNGLNLTEPTTATASERATTSLLGGDDSIDSTDSSAVAGLAGKAGEHPCPECDKKYTRKSDLVVHMRMHSGEKPFQCADCSKSFTKKSHLTRHKKIHTGEKPFVCSICQKRHARMSDLKVHLRIHTGERPYKCRVCTKSFITSSHVRMHERTHDETRRYSCELCTKTFKTKPGLNQHLKTSHNLDRDDVKAKTALAAKKAMEVENNKLLNHKLELLEQHKKQQQQQQPQQMQQAQVQPQAGIPASWLGMNLMSNPALSSANAAIINSSLPSFPTTHIQPQFQTPFPASVPQFSNPAPFQQHQPQQPQVSRPDEAYVTSTTDGDVRISANTLKELPQSVVSQLLSLGIIRNASASTAAAPVATTSMPQQLPQQLPLNFMLQSLSMPQQNVQQQQQVQQPSFQGNPLFDTSALNFQSVKEEAEPTYVPGIGAASDDFIFLRDGDMVL